jgi:hypothetical protein
MSRNRNLAGLAALGALGYMMARGGKKTPAEAAATPVEDRGSMARALIEDDRESQRGEFNPAGLKRNTETGEMYDPSGDVLGGRFTGRQRPVVSTPGGRVQSTRSEAKPYAREEFLTDLTREMSRGVRGRIPVVGTQNPQRGPSFEEIRQKNEQDRIDALRASGGMRAKGGAIKMAAGGSVSSASRRGDGIAQRGKTKGRMR